MGAVPHRLDPIPALERGIHRADDGLITQTEPAGDIADETVDDGFAALST